MERVFEKSSVSDEPAVVSEAAWVFAEPAITRYIEPADIEETSHTAARDTGKIIPGISPVTAAVHAPPCQYLAKDGCLPFRCSYFGCQVSIGESRRGNQRAIQGLVEGS